MTYGRMPIITRLFRAISFEVSCALMLRFCLHAHVSCSFWPRECLPCAGPPTGAVPSSCDGPASTCTETMLKGAERNGTGRKFTVTVKTHGNARNHGEQKERGRKGRKTEGQTTGGEDEEKRG